MPSLFFTGHQSIAEADVLLSATLDGKPLGVRVSTEAFTDFGLAAAMDKAVEKAKAGKFEDNGGIRVTTSDFV